MVHSAPSSAPVSLTETKPGIAEMQFLTIPNVSV